MSFLTIDLPPGIKRDGTEYQAKGRWFETDLVRWYGRTLGPVYGWVGRSGLSVVTGMARALWAWRLLGGSPILAIGTHQKLYVQGIGGTNTDITPAGFIAGQTDATSTTPALVWDLDNFGQVLVGVAFSDGRLFNYDPAGGATPAIVTTGAPTGNYGVVVTEQRFVMVLGAGGNARKIQWADQERLTTWTPAATNQAGDLELQTNGRIVRGVRVGAATLVLTDIDAHLGTYLGPPFVYGFQRVGSGCGIKAKGAVCTFGSRAVWWSESGFWLYDGIVQPLESEVLAFLQKDLNPAQWSKVTSFHNSQFGEVWWFYPSGSNTEIDRYVFWDYRKNCWGNGFLSRTAACEGGVFPYPIMMDTQGVTFDHERGFDYLDAEPRARSGPIELGAGDRVMSVTGIIPDEDTVGATSVTFLSRDFPDSDQNILQTVAFTTRGRADARFQARQVEIRVTGSAPSAWRWGTARLDVKPRGSR